MRWINPHVSLTLAAETGTDIWRMKGSNSHFGALMRYPLPNGWSFD